MKKRIVLLIAMVLMTVDVAYGSTLNWKNF